MKMYIIKEADKMRSIPIAVSFNERKALTMVEKPYHFVTKVEVLFK